MTSWKYTPEMTAWIRENSNGVEWDDLAPLFNEMFGCDKTARQLRSHAHDNGIHNGIWRKNPYGKTPRRHRPVGSKRLDKDGYVVVKIAEPCKWRREQFVIWEQYHKPINIRKEMLVHLDGNPQNNDIDNLYLMPRKYQMTMIKLDLYKYLNKDNVETLMQLVKLDQECWHKEVELYGGERQAISHRNRQNYNKNKHDPDFMERHRKSGREYARKNRTKIWCKLKSNPERYERYKEYSRIWARNHRKKQP